MSQHGLDKNDGGFESGVPNACLEFRALLEQALLSWVDDRPGTEQLSWHAHLTDCDSCQRLVAEEHALDELLAVWREGASGLPGMLPVGLAKRVLVRLQSSRGRTLDQILGMAEAPAAPPKLGSDILAGLRAERDTNSDADSDTGSAVELDDLLARVPAPQVPVSLTADILMRARTERSSNLGRADETAAPLRFVSRRQPAWGLVAAAAGVLVSFLAWRVFSGGVVRDVPPIEIASSESQSNRVRLQDPVERVGANDPLPHTPAGSGSASAPEVEVTDELLLALEVLERWDEVNDADFDSVLGTLVGELDEAWAEADVDESFWGVLNEAPVKGEEAR